jgi:cobalt-zinc-cadmium efflux system outer membrane protein
MCIYDHQMPEVSLPKVVKINKKLKFTFLLCLWGICLSISFKTYAQNNLQASDTVTINIQDAEQRFITQDLAIIAAKYDVDIAKTNVLQSKLWYNPNVTYSQTFYNNGTKKFFDTDPNSTNGEWNVQIQQMISYAGRHVNQVKLDKIDVERAQYTFVEVVRALKLQMYNDFSAVYGDQQKASLFKRQIISLDTLIASTKKQLTLGVSSKNDLIRLQAEELNDKNQLLATESDLQDNETDLKILLHYPLKSYLKTQNNSVSDLASLPAMADVLNAANQNRGDLKYSHKTIDYQVQNLRLQRSLAVPDLSIGLDYDKAGSAGYDYSGISISSDIPFFNRNQGQIAAAKYQISKAQVSDTLQSTTVEEEVAGAYFKLFKYKEQFDATDKNYASDLDQLEKSAIDNYGKKLISLLDFLDQMRTYTSAKSDLIDLKTNYFNAGQNLNYQVGTTIIK